MRDGIVTMFRGFLAFSTVAMICNVVICPLAYSIRSYTLLSLVILPILMNVLAYIRLRMLIHKYSDVFGQNKSVHSHSPRPTQF